MTSERSWAGKRLGEVEGTPLLGQCLLDQVSTGLSCNSWEALKTILRNSSSGVALQIPVSVEITTCQWKGLQFLGPVVSELPG